VAERVAAPRRTTLARTAPSRRPAAWRIEPLTPARWRDFTALFGARGACAGCWCTWARLTHAEFRSRTEAQRRAFIRRVVGKGEPPGLLAYDGEQAVGWIAVAPRTEFRRLASSRVLAPVDERPVWSVPCFFIARTHRGRGLTVALLKAACAHAASRGARWVEGYPVDTRGASQPAAFVWPGLPSAFVAAGFREVERRSPARPIMRRAVRASRAQAARG
jgi:GNAT superfamily N-acetyltransferase